MSIRKVGVLGAGQMGGGIAQVAAAAEFDVVLCDATVELAQKGRAKIDAILGKQVEKGKITEDVRKALVARITPAAGPSEFADCDLVVEAATENVDLKLKLFSGCDAAMKPGAILASNTSSISLTKLAGVTKRPENVIGMHFMNPPPLMKLVEIVRAVQTSDETYALVRAAAEKMGKITTTSKDAPGFLVNRILIPMLCEACFALQEGVGTPEDIDQGAKLGLNHPMGPLELSDLIGLDTVLAIADVLHRDIGDDKYRAPTLLRNLVAAGWLGKKVGKGFYAYDDKGQKTGEVRMTAAQGQDATILLEKGPIATITLNRPDKLNALNAALLGELAAALREVDEDASTRAIILTGAGEKAFAAGADIAAMANMTATEARAFASLGHGVLEAIERARVPVIGAVNGFALGGGCEIALACDFLYASENAKFGQPEVNLGVIPGFGGTQRLARRVGIGHARELCYTGDVIDAKTALAIGLVNKVVPLAELIAAAKATATKIGEKGPLAVTQTKRVILRGADVPLPVANELEAQAFAALFGSEDQREGMRAFLEKKKAVFKGA